MTWTLLLTIVATVVVVVLAMNFATPEKKLERKIGHRYDIADPQYPARDERAARPGDPARQPHHRPAERQGNLPGDAAGDRLRAEDHHVRDLYLLVGRDRTEVQRCAVRARPRRRQGQRHHRLGRQHQDGQQAARADGNGRGAGASLSTAALVQPRPPQQPHPSQAAGRGRPHRLHRRRRHRRPVGRQRAGPGPLARHAFPHRRAGRRAVAERVQRQLDQDHRRSAQRRRLLSAAGTGRRHGGAPVHLLARRRQREHALDVPDGDRRGRAHDRPGGGLLRTRRVDQQGADRSAPTRRAHPHPAAWRTHRFGNREAGLEGDLGRSVDGRCRDP